MLKILDLWRYDRIALYLGLMFNKSKQCAITHAQAGPFCHLLFMERFIRPCVLLLRPGLVLRRWLVVVTVLAMSAPSLQAATLQVEVGIETTRLFDGLNLSGDRPAVSLTADWAFNGGGFSGANCFAADVSSNDGLRNGCSLYLGYFQPTSDVQAFSFQLSHHEFARSRQQDWSFSEAEASWHIDQKTMLSLGYTRGWFNRPSDTLSIKGLHVRDLSDKLSVELSGSVTAFDQIAPINTLTFAKAALVYRHQRWLAQVALSYGDDRLRQLVGFDVDRAELSLSLAYRLY